MSHVVRNRSLRLLLVLALSVGIRREARAIGVAWANAMGTTTGTVTSPMDALHSPDDAAASFNSSGASAPFTGFGPFVEYDTSSLATLLGVTEAVLIEADFIAIDRDLTPMGFETSTWVFTDGSGTLTVPHVVGGPLALGELAVVSPTPTNFGAFFGFGPSADEYAIILFDIDGVVDPFSPSFTVTVTSGGAADPLTPDIEALAIVVARFVRGDVDVSGEVNLTDAVNLLFHLFLGGAPPSCADSADADDSGKLELTDAIWILNWLFSGGPPPPPPQPLDTGGVASPVYDAGKSCGKDPTPDSLHCVSFPPCL